MEAVEQKPVKEILSSYMYPEDKGGVYLETDQFVYFNGAGALPTMKGHLYKVPLLGRFGLIRLAEFFGTDTPRFQFELIKISQPVSPLDWRTLLCKKSLEELSEDTLVRVYACGFGHVYLIMAEGNCYTNGAYVVLDSDYSCGLEELQNATPSSLKKDSGGKHYLEKRNGDLSIPFKKEEIKDPFLKVDFKK